MKTRKPKPPSNEEIYNLGLLLLEEIRLNTRQLIALQKSLSQEKKAQPDDKPFTLEDGTCS